MANPSSLDQAPLSLLPLTGRPDILLVSLGTTMGWRANDQAFAEQVRAAGATCELVTSRMGVAGRLPHTMALTDVVEGLAARRAAGRDARATIYCSVTAALLQPPRSPVAVRFDTTAALNRPGLGGAWQRRRERSVLARATLLLPFSEMAAESAASAAGPAPPPLVVLPPPVPTFDAGGLPPGAVTPLTIGAVPPFDAIPPVAPLDWSPPDVVAYGGDPHKRGIDLLYAAWREVRPEGGRLAVGGLERGEAMRRLHKAGVQEPPGVEWMGAVSRERWMATVAGARLFVNASRFEDWGLAQMEALAAGTPLVTVPSGGPNVALPLARALAPELVAPARTADALAAAMRAGLALGPSARRSYAEHADRLLAPYREEALRRQVAEEVLPLLLDSSS